MDLLTNTATTLDLKAQGNKVVLPGITEMQVNDLDDIDNIILLGQKNRTVAATKMNSSRFVNESLLSLFYLVALSIQSQTN